MRWDWTRERIPPYACTCARALFDFRSLTFGLMGMGKAPKLLGRGPDPPPRNKKKEKLKTLLRQYG